MEGPPYASWGRGFSTEGPHNDERACAYSHSQFACPLPVYCPDMPTPQALLRHAVELARQNVREAGGHPFGAVIARDGEVLYTGVNECVQTGDPTAHAEMVALRNAGRELGPDALTGGTVYASGIPCPMCLAAMHFAGISEVVYAFSQDDAAPYDLSTEHVYAEVCAPNEDSALPMRYDPVRANPDDEPTLYQLWADECGAK